MNLTPEQQAVGRRNFLKAVAGVPALAGLGAAAAVTGPVRGGPVRVGVIGLGGEGRVLLAQTDPAYAEVVALCDINPAQLGLADEVLGKTARPAATHVVEWKELIARDGYRGRHRRHAALVARRDCLGLPRGGQARAVRKDDGVGSGGLRPDA